ncbi:hypothetical protein [Natronocalculus amylovorans]|uniref:Uncharacterized protein n=1 Tax=Natronocalculus amylovorans TaxID=2917812 RepID=A0AAE3K8B9_9EURY|nr:hypothetical protein [Natronocalculus amylovorans]MCL9816355.1 hypothetical protein [Natronocalculus amylovorans]
MSTDETDGETYTHRPGSIDNEQSDEDPFTEPEPSGFGAQGWVLVAAVVICFLVIPGVIYLFPAAPTQLGWTFFATFLVLPLIPAVLLGVIAVWSMTAAT